MSQKLLMRKKKILYNFKKFYPALDVKNISIFVEPEFELKRNSDISENINQNLSINIEEDNPKTTGEPDKPLPPELAKALKSLKKSILKKNK